MKRFLRFILKFFIIILMAVYVFIGFFSSITLFKMEISKRQDISTLSAVIKKAVAEDRPNDVYAWMHYRPLAETEALIAIITPESSRLGTNTFLELSRRQMQRGRKEDALFWAQLARYRLRYDALRCGAPDSTETLNRILQLFSSPQIQDLLQKHPELVKKSVQQVLDFDSQHPARNSPAFVCTALDRITKSGRPQVPEEQWENIRLTLRSVTEYSLKEMNGKQP